MEGGESNRIHATCYLYMTSYSKRCFRATEKKGKETKHNSLEAAISQRKISCFRWDWNTILGLNRQSLEGRHFSRPR